MKDCVQFTKNFTQDHEPARRLWLAPTPVVGGFKKYLARRFTAGLSGGQLFPSFTLFLLSHLLTCFTALFSTPVGGYLSIWIFTPSHKSLSTND
jgi:hypothetical protein